MSVRFAGWLALFALTFVTRHAWADETAPKRDQATFALIIGSNHSVDANVAPLRYADDDAARSFDLFRLLGARTYLLTRLDDNSRRLHPQAAAEATEPRQASFDRAVAQLVADVTQAVSRNLTADVYIVYAGHGNVDDGHGYLTLEDARITGADLSEIVRRVPATRIHIIADACSSYFVANARGPGGQRRAISGFRAAALEDPRVGLLLSTSSARVSHEWDAFQAGVFSHVVRSGLYGGADADGDGVVSYTEIAAFIARASSSVPNEKYRPQAYVRAPRGSQAFLELRRSATRRLVIEGAHAGHYFLEDAHGVRLLDVHNGQSQALDLVRPGPQAGALFLRRVDDDKEFFVEATAPEVVTTAQLTPRPSSFLVRGAEHEAFKLLFSLPFDAGVVQSYDARPPEEPAPDVVETAPRSGPRRTLGYAALGLAAAGVGVGTYFAISANETVQGTPRNASNADAGAREARASDQRTAAIVSFSVGGAAAVGAALLWLWPRAPAVHASLAPGSAFVGYGVQFQ